MGAHRKPNAVKALADVWRKDNDHPMRDELRTLSILMAWLVAMLVYIVALLVKAFNLL